MKSHRWSEAGSQILQGIVGHYEDAGFYFYSQWARHHWKSSMIGLRF